jgi:uridine kinase
MKSLSIGIAGGTGSGKTTLAKRIIDYFGQNRISFLEADTYYHDRSHLPLHARHHLNFDHPNALDFPLLIDHIKALKDGKPVNKQMYDFATHTRTRETVRIDSKDFVVVEGILIFAVEDVSKLFDLKVFLEEEADIRLLRRIDRDMKERGRSLDSVVKQYLEMVRPMHVQYVEPSKDKADIVLSSGEGAGRVIKSIEELTQILQ